MAEEPKLKQRHVDAIKRSLVRHAESLRSARKRIGLNAEGHIAQGDDLIAEWVKLVRGLHYKPQKNGRLVLMVRAAPLGSALVALDLDRFYARVLDFKV
ncbi:MAG: hypothetical protein R3200_01830 [Xanthomonadales bacterium]|nr:hypothetical protein [Xanthomonadales bacterium]